VWKNLRFCNPPPLAKGRHGEEIRWGRLKMRDLMLDLGLDFGNKTAQIIAKNPIQFTA